MPETNIKEKIISVNSREKYLLRLGKVLDRIHFASDIANVLRELRKDILMLLNVEELFTFSITEDQKNLYLALGEGENRKELIFPMDTNSIPGYVALTKVPLVIQNAYSAKELMSINPKLQFQRDHDLFMGVRSLQVMALPIMWGKAFLGVFYVCNKLHGDIFTEDDKHSAIKIAAAFAMTFHNSQQARFDYYRKYAPLIQQKILSKEQVDSALQQAKESKVILEEVLIKRYNVDKMLIKNALTTYYNTPLFEFKPGLIVPNALLPIFNANYLRKNLWVPFGEENGKLLIAIDNPRTLYKLDDIKKQNSFREYSLHIALPEDIIKTIDYFWGPQKKGLSEKETFKQIIKKIETTSLQDTDKKTEEKVADVTEMDHVVVRMVNQMIKDAHSQGASDIYIEPSVQKDRPINIRFRIDGICYEYNKVPSTFKRVIISRIKIMAELDIAHRMTPQDGKIAFANFSDIDIELRVAIVPIVGGDESAVIRLLAAKEPIPLEKLGMRTPVYSKFKELIQTPYGILLVVGPTGSGKTTSLHSGLGFLNTPRKKIWTAEDPVEIVQEGLSQVQIHNKSGFTFAKAMRAFLRCAPDVIMIGEMRDHETASTAIEASLTGHLVLSTLHTNSAPETITRLIDMDIDPFNFGDALIGVLAQRLVRTLCPSCKQQTTLDEDIFQAIVHEYDYESPNPTNDLTFNKDFKMYTTQGCNKCINGLKGRMGIHELLVNTREITRLIHKKALVEEIRHVAIEQGMRTLKQDGIHKVFSGIADMHQIRSVCLK